MKTNKKLIIGLAVLAISVMDVRGEFVAKVITKDGEHDEIKLHRINEGVSHNFNDHIYTTSLTKLDLFGGRRPPSDEKWPGYKQIHLPAYLRMVEVLDLTDNNLTSFVVPPGMVQLRTIRLAGNTQLTNLVLQQDTGVRLEQYWLETIERTPDIDKRWLSPSFISVESRTRGAAAWVTIELGKLSNHRVLKETSVPLKRLSAPEWMKRRIQYHGVTYETLFDIEHDWRPSGAESVHWGNQVIVCWGPGILQSSHGFPLEWYDVFCVGEFFYGREPGEHRWKLANERYALHGEWSPEVVLFRVRKPTGIWQDVKYTAQFGEEKIRREWRLDCYRRPHVAPIPEVLINQP